MLERGEGPQPPDVMARLQEYRWITHDEGWIHWVAEAMGKLAETGYIPPFGWQWGDWPPWYLDSVISYYYYKVVLNEQRKAEYYQKKLRVTKAAANHKGYNATNATGNRLPPQASEELQQAALQLSSRMAQLPGKFFKKPGK